MTGPKNILQLTILGGLSCISFLVQKLPGCVLFPKDLTVWMTMGNDATVTLNNNRKGKSWQ